MKILLLDIECSPNLVFCWGLHNQFISLDQIKEPGRTICWSAKWLGSNSPIMHSSINETTFETMIHQVYDLLSEADAVIHYNGDRYDIPVLNREFVECGLTPPKPSENIDLYKVVKKRFRFPSNKLAYVVRALGLGKKMDTNFSLWVGCMEGDPASWAKMKRYNKNDLVILERLYNKVKGWIKRHPNHGLYTESSRMVCPNCGGRHLVSRGYRRTKTRLYRQWHCKSCGSWPSSRVSEKREADKNVLAGG